MPAPIKIIPNPYKEVARLEDGTYQFNFSSSLKWLEKNGKKAFGSHFSISKEDHELIFKLMVYAIGDKVCCAKKKYKS